MKLYAVFGHPIAHSQSPFIHQQFALQQKIEMNYQARLATIEGFEQALTDFFQLQGGLGANITTPFKERAYHYCDTLDERVTSVGAVNTIKQLANGEIIGDNTDGVGLVMDLQRLKMLKPAATRVLILGAGGAVRGVIQPLLSMQCIITVTNRTMTKAEALAKHFSAFGCIDITASPQEHYDLIINATSSGIQGQIPQIPVELIQPTTAYYDMFYQSGLTPFLQWVKTHQGLHYADGLGMLVGQAAHAFYFWHGKMPVIEPVLTALRKKLGQ